MEPRASLAFSIIILIEARVCHITIIREVIESRLEPLYYYSFLTSRGFTDTLMTLVSPLPAFIAPFSTVCAAFKP
jgi:hypothetical protein